MRDNKITAGHWKRKTYSSFIRPRRISMRARGRMLAKAFERAAKTAMKGTLGLNAD